MNRPGILHINTERGWRGGERQTFLLMRELCRRGHETWLAARPDQPLADTARREGLHVIPLSPWTEWDVFAAARLAAAAREHGLDILHAHTGHAVGLGALAKTFSGSHQLVATRRVDNPLSANPLSRWKYARADAVVGVANKVADIVIAGGVPSKKVRVIHSGVDRTGHPSAQDRPRLRAERGWNDQDQVVMTAGALVPQKDQATFIRAAARVRASRPKVKFVILGEGPLRRDLENQIRRSGLTETVYMWGHRPDVAANIVAADVFVLSSVSEGIGGVLIEAMALGIPTSATLAGGLADLYGGPEAVELTPPGDDTALARNILRVLDDPAESRRRAVRGQATASRFTASAMADAYEALYDELRNPSTPSPAGRGGVV